MSKTICIPLFHKLLPNHMPKTIHTHPLNDVLWFVLHDPYQFVESLFVDLCEGYMHEHPHLPEIPEEVSNAFHREIAECESWVHDVHDWLKQAVPFDPKYLGGVGDLHLDIRPEQNLVLATPIDDVHKPSFAGGWL